MLLRHSQTVEVVLRAPLTFAALHHCCLFALISSESPLQAQLKGNLVRAQFTNGGENIKRLSENLQFPLFAKILPSHSSQQFPNSGGEEEKESLLGVERKKWEPRTQNCHSGLFA